MISSTSDILLLYSWERTSIIFRLFFSTSILTIDTSKFYPQKSKIKIFPWTYSAIAIALVAGLLKISKIFNLASLQAFIISYF